MLNIEKIINNEKIIIIAQYNQVIQEMARKFFEIIHKYIEKNFTKT